MSADGPKQQSLLKQAGNFQYIRFVCSDMDGIPRGKTATKHGFHQLNNGMAFELGIIATGYENYAPSPLGPVGPNYVSTGVLLPALEQITPISWFKGQHKVGEVLCEISDPKTCESLDMNPRTIARKQLESLNSHGLRLMSSFELEGLILSKENLRPLTSCLQNMTVLPLSEVEDILYECEEKVQSAGIEVENIHCEYDPGQIEVTFRPTFGIKCADNAFRFKQAFKEICLQKGYLGTFVTKPIDIESCNGAHFNLSLWTEENKNAFYDPEEPDKLSKTCLYFIGGVLHHLHSLCALCCPTVNCYRRMHEAIVPTQADWDIDNCDVALRIKNFGENHTYIECRLPSGSANPYLVTASVMAAGLEGIENQIEPPPRGIGENPNSLPHSLTEALDALTSDQKLQEHLGKDFVEWFLAYKNHHEVTRFAGHNTKIMKNSELQDEIGSVIYYL